MMVHLEIIASFWDILLLVFIASLVGSFFHQVGGGLYGYCKSKLKKNKRTMVSEEYENRKH